MHTTRTPGTILLFGLLVLVVSLSACSGPWLRVRQVPENGYAQTINYQFQAQIHSDSDGNCEMMVVRVRPLNKMYSRGEPPQRLQLFDDDCNEPIRFERAQFVSRETGAQVRLSGPEVTRFLGDNFQLESELMEWLFQAEII